MALPNTNQTYQYLGGAFEDGTVFGKTSASVLGFWGATPSVQVAFSNATNGCDHGGKQARRRPRSP